MTRLITRRSIISTGAMSLAALTPLVSRFTQGVGAEKNTGKKPSSIAKRANDFIADCFQLGGDPTVTSTRPGGTTVTCKTGGGTQNCTFTKKNTRCYSVASAAGNSLSDVPTVPIVPGEGELTLTSSDEKSRNRRKR